MTRIKGIDIVLLDEIKTGEDPFGADIFEIKEIIVKNVLVYPSSTDDITNNLNLYGKKTVYTLALPKGDNHEWTDKIVKFFGKSWRVFGTPVQGIESMIPLSWNKKIMVESYE